MTRIVNSAVSKIRLQGAKLFDSPSSKEVLVLDFYPEFKDLAFVWEGASVVGLELSQVDPSQLKASKHPFLLYLKAHFVGHQLSKMNFDTEKVEFIFHSERSFEWDFAKKEWIFKVEGRKDYLQRLPLWASLNALLPQEISKKELLQKNEKTKVELKFEKLKTNVEKDILEARAWLDKNAPAIGFFFQSPQLWGETLDKIPQKFHSWIQEISKTIPFAGSRKLALENLKKLQSRYTRKVEKAEERLLELSRQIAPKDFKNLKAKEEKQQDKVAGPKRVPLNENIEAIVGRKAHENDELFRKAQSRDLWFHVRGQRGAHVWIKRGQKGFGAKGELSEDLLRKAATLAVKFSKASGAWVSVDYTERRFLKKLKGSDAGALQVLQSKTIFVSMDEDKN